MQTEAFSRGRVEDSLVEVFHKIDLMLKDETYLREIENLSSNQVRCMFRPCRCVSWQGSPLQHRDWSEQPKDVDNFRLRVPAMEVPPAPASHRAALAWADVMQQVAGGLL